MFLLFKYSQLLDSPMKTTKTLFQCFFDVKMDKNMNARKDPSFNHRYRAL